MHTQRYQCRLPDPELKIVCRKMMALGYFSTFSCYCTLHLLENMFLSKLFESNKKKTISFYNFNTNKCFYIIYFC